MRGCCAGEYKSSLCCKSLELPHSSLDSSPTHFLFSKVCTFERQFHRTPNQASPPNLFLDTNIGTERRNWSKCLPEQLSNTPLNNIRCNQTRMTKDKDYRLQMHLLLITLLLSYFPTVNFCSVNATRFPAKSHTISELHCAVCRFKRSLSVHPTSLWSVHLWKFQLSQHYD